MTTRPALDPDLLWDWTRGSTAGERDLLLDGLLPASYRRRAAITHLCPRCGSSEHGRPLLPPDLHTHMSVTSAPGWTGLAVSGIGPVGIDIDVAGGPRYAGLAPVVLGPEEDVDPYDATALARSWVRKEAIVKALGLGLSLDPREVQVSSGSSGLRVVSLPPGYDPTEVRLFDLELPADLVGAAALLAPADVEVSCRRAASAAPARAARHD